MARGRTPVASAFNSFPCHTAHHLASSPLTLLSAMPTIHSTLVSRLHPEGGLGVKLPPFRKPRSLQEARQNVDTALSLLRESPHAVAGVPQEYLWHGEAMLKGELEAVWGLVWHLKAAFPHVQPLYTATGLRTRPNSGRSSGQSSVDGHEEGHARGGAQSHPQAPWSAVPTLPYSTHSQWRLERSLLSWLHSLGILQAECPLGVPRDLHQIQGIIENGQLLGRLAEVMTRRPVPGLLQRPATAQLRINNIDKACAALRQLPSLTPRFLHFAPEIARGNREVILGLLEDCHRCYNGVSPPLSQNAQVATALQVRGAQAVAADGRGYADSLERLEPYFGDHVPPSEPPPPLAPDPRYKPRTDDTDGGQDGAARADIVPSRTASMAEGASVSSLPMPMASAGAGPAGATMHGTGRHSTAGSAGRGCTGRGGWWTYIMMHVERRQSFPDAVYRTLIHNPIERRQFLLLTILIVCVALCVPPLPLMFYHPPHPFPLLLPTCPISAPFYPPCVPSTGGFMHPTVPLHSATSTVSFAEPQSVPPPPAPEPAHPFQRRRPGPPPGHTQSRIPTLQHGTRTGRTGYEPPSVTPVIELPADLTALLMWLETKSISLDQPATLQV